MPHQRAPTGQSNAALSGLLPEIITLIEGGDSGQVLLSLLSKVKTFFQGFEGAAK